MKGDSSKHLEKSYFDVLGLCCSSEVPLIEKILKPLAGVHHVSVVVPTRTVIVLHDVSVISQSEIVKVLNKARLEANVRMKGDQRYQNKWPSPLAVVCGVLLLLSFLKYIYSPLKWLAVGAVAVGIGPLILKAFASLGNRRIDFNLLMVIAVGGSISLKDYSEAGTIVFLLTISEWLNSRAGHKATSVMSSLMSIAPQTAVLADTGEEVNTEEVMVNTRLAVKAGTMIPIDGVVVEGSCEVDEKTLTGESFPVSKQVDSIVWAGTLNLNGYISVKTTALAEACVVAKMAKLVEEAQNNKSKTQRYVDKIAKYYTPVVCVVAACLAGIPAALRVHDIQQWYHLALVVLVAACPCALILSTPVAAFCALSKAATSGLLVKGAEYLETLSMVKFICFDKTGTITKGEFSVSSFHPLIDNHNLLYWVSSLESKSSHPMAAALIEYACTHSIEPQPDNVEEFKNFPGEGIYGKIDGKDIYVGNQKIAIRAGCAQVPRNWSENNEGNSIGYVFVGSTPAGIFSLSDSCRIGVKEALEELKSMGIRTAMLTGDGQAAANYAQNQLGGALGVVHAELLPQDKANIIKELQKQSKTAMIGDGLNDAPALATADIGISMGVSGSALANETSHIILMSNDIRKIPVAVRLARKTRRKIFENIFIAFITKAAIIALAIAGHPLVWAAVLADVGTCLLVTFNSMLMLQGTSLRSLKTRSGSSPNPAQCSSGCCGQEDNVKGLKHLVQETKEYNSCCTRIDIPEREETICGCCDDDANEAKHVVQSKQGKATPDDDNEIHEVKIMVQPQQAAQIAHKAEYPIQETKCCDSVTKETKCCSALRETKCSSAPIETKCCSIPKETKCCDSVTKETKCCSAPRETKCSSAPIETKCCSVPKETKCSSVPRETKCCDNVTKETKGSSVLRETKCCDSVTKETKFCSVPKETKCTSVPRETKCCDSVTKETKCSGVQKETKCCSVPKETKCCGSVPKETKGSSVPKETKGSSVPKETKCCSVPKETNCSSVTRETKCCDSVTKKTKWCSVPKETKCCGSVPEEAKGSSVPKETKCCDSVTKETKCCSVPKETKCSSVLRETKCCDSVTKETKCSSVPGETKGCDSVTKETKCCDNVTKETKCSSIPRETECRDSVTKETKFCSVPKDLESQRCSNSVNQEFVNTSGGVCDRGGGNESDERVLHETRLGKEEGEWMLQKLF